jgi:hypothetical protein
MIGSKEMITLKFSEGLVPAFRGNVELGRANLDHHRKGKKMNGPEIISLTQARVALADAGWSDVRFLAFCHGSVLIILPEEKMIRIALKEHEVDALLDILTAKDRERASHSKPTNTAFTSLAA